MNDGPYRSATMESPFLMFAREWLNAHSLLTLIEPAHEDMEQLKVRIDRDEQSLVALLESVVASTREEDRRRIEQLEARVMSLSVTLNWIKHELLLRDSNIIDRIDKAVKT